MCCLSHTLTQAVQASSDQSPFTLNPIQIRIILTRNDTYSRDSDICMRGAVTSLPAPLTIKGSAPITGRSIGASLILCVYVCIIYI